MTCQHSEQFTAGFSLRFGLKPTNLSVTISVILMLINDLKHELLNDFTSYIYYSSFILLLLIIFMLGIYQILQNMQQIQPLKRAKVSPPKHYRDKSRCCLAHSVPAVMVLCATCAVIYLSILLLVTYVYIIFKNSNYWPLYIFKLMALQKVQQFISLSISYQR